MFYFVVLKQSNEVVILMRLKTICIALAILLSIITITSVASRTTAHTLKLEGVTSKIANQWFGYVNETGQYAYGAQIILTNTKSTNLALTNLHAEVYGVGGTGSWSSGVPIASSITLPPGGSKTIDIYSSNLNTTTLGAAGAKGSFGYLSSIEDQWNKMIFRLEGDTRSYGDPLQFDIFAGPSSGMRMTTDQRVGDHYSGLFWFITPNAYFIYQPPQRGVIGTAKFPYLTLLGGSDHYSVSLSMVDARTLTVQGSEGPVIFYMMDGEFKFASLLNSFGRDGDQIYFYGNVMNYTAPNGGSYRLIQLTETSTSEIVDPEEVAKNLIVSRVGEDYFRKYFSGPSVGYDRFGGNSTHVVTYQYHMSIGGYSTSQDIALSFNYFGKLTGGAEFIPMLGNLQPFNVTLEKAEEMAVNAGVPRTPFGLEASIGFWSHTPGGPVNSWNDKYVWSVSSWLDPSSSNPRREVYAFIDPVSGEVYSVQQGEVGFVSIG